MTGAGAAGQAGPRARRGCRGAAGTAPTLPRSTVGSPVLAETSRAEPAESPSCLGQGGLEAGLGHEYSGNATELPLGRNN